MGSEFAIHAHQVLHSVCSECVPTTLPRTVITHTPPVRRCLSIAAAATSTDDGDSSTLMLWLMEEGAKALQHRALVDAYAEAYSEWAGSEDGKLWAHTDMDGLEAVDETR